MRNLLLIVLVFALSLGQAFAQTDAETAEEAMAEMAPPVMGAIEFIELPSANLAESQEFYGSLFGWTFSEMPEMQGEFIFFTTPNHENEGGFSTMTKPAVESGPTLYISVESVSAKLEEIAAAGGSTVMEPMALPGEGWGFIATFSDPHGNVLGLWSIAE